MTIWEKFPNLSDSELRTLVATTARVMLDSEEARAQLPPDLLNISTAAASREVIPLLSINDLPSDQAAEAVQGALEDEDQSKEVALAVLEEVKKQPELAQRVAESYEERTHKMAGIELTLLTSALVILAIKIKEFQWSKDKTKITFTESAEVIKGFLTGIVNGILGK